MKTDINLVAYDLYLRHIILEAFPQDFLSTHNDDVFLVNVSIDENLVIVTSRYNGFFSEYKTSVFEHTSRSLAITSSIGRCVLEIASQLGFSKVPYGVLTGVRPIKIASELSRHLNKSEFVSLMNSKYLVTSTKSDLLYSCSYYDNLIRSKTCDKDVSVYISIPFCPTRCNYCSFVSSSIERKKSLVPDYLKLLLFEISEISKIINKHQLRVNSIYVGGGTPGILSECETELLLKTINENIPVNTLKEFTYEIGRPDTVTREKLSLLKDFGVTRISINTQTTNNAVLEAIGRNHTAEEYFNAVNMALPFSFNSINTDLIAGLKNESYESFEKSVREVINTGIDNITIHTLCLKKSAQIKTEGTNTSISDVDKSISFSKKYCISCGFDPYYLYRQKYSLGNHESVGYCKDKKFSHYNIAMMNEVESVIGIGAGATTRILSNFSGEKHVHLANYKYPQDYIMNYGKISEHISDIDNFFETKFSGVSE